MSATPRPGRTADAPVSAVVSIAIPCYNQAEFLGELLASLREQTFAAWEAVVVDDASTKGDPAAVVAAAADPRCRVLRQPRNAGPSAARNAGFRVTRGELFVAVDSDDCLAPSFLEETVAALQRHPEADCVFTFFQLFGTRDDVWQYRVRRPEDILVSQWLPGPGTVMRRRLWEDVGGHSELPGLIGNEDWEFWIGALERGLTAIGIDKPLYRYRVHPQSLTHTRLDYADATTRELIYRRHRAFFDRHRAGAAFRAAGYFNSSAASMQRGERLRALRQAARGLWLAPRSSPLRHQLLDALSPRLHAALAGAAGPRPS